jgi:hypothetical protein
MERVMGRVVQGENVVADNLTILLEVTRGPVKSWHGSFVLPEGVILGVGKSYWN